MGQMEETCKVSCYVRPDPDNVDGAQDIGNNTGDKYIRVEMPFNSLMTNFLNMVILTS